MFSANDSQSLEPSLRASERGVAIQTPFNKWGCLQSGQGDLNSSYDDEKISPSALLAATPLYERGYLENTSNSNDGFLYVSKGQKSKPLVTNF